MVIFWVRVNVSILKYKSRCNRGCGTVDVGVRYSSW